MELDVFIKHSNNCFVSLPAFLVNQIFEQLEFLSTRSSLLPLEVTWFNPDENRAHRVFLGWAGETSTHPGLEISFSFASLIELRAGQKIFVRPIPLSQLQTAHSVEVEPLTTDDWEIVELHADFLEEQILNQICVVFEGEVFPIYINQISVKLKVVSMNPKTNDGVVYLANNTEVMIAPKPRKKPQQMNQDETTTVFAPLKGNQQLSAQQEQQHKITMKSRELRVAPYIKDTGIYTAVLNPVTCDQFKWENIEYVQIWKVKVANDNDNENDKSSKSISKKFLLRIVIDDIVPYGHVMLPKMIRDFMEISLCSYVRMKPIDNLKPKRIEYLNLQEIYGSKEQEIDQDQIIKLIKDLFTSSKSIYQNIPMMDGTPIKLYLSTCSQHVNNDIRITSEYDTTDYCHHCNKHFKWFKLSFQSQQQQQQQPFIMNKLDINYCKINITSQNGSSKKEIEESTTTTTTTMIRIQDIGGSDTQLNTTIEYLSSIFNQSNNLLRIQLHSDDPTGLLICGSHGSGKTMLAQAVSNHFQNDLSSLVYINEIKCSELTEKRIERVKDIIIDSFKISLINRPSIILFDDIDLLLPSVQDQEILRSAQLSEFIVECFYDARKLSKIPPIYLSSTTTTTSSTTPITILATSQNATSLHKTLKDHHLFGLTVELSAPNHPGRIQILDKLFKKKALTSSIIENSEELNRISSRHLMLSNIASTTDGYLGHDLEQLIDRSIDISSMEYINNDDLSIVPQLSIDHVKEAQKGFIPISLKGIQLHTSEVEWKDIGGLHDVRRILKETLEWPSKYPKLFENIPLRPRSGLLLFGPPGCGKTALASAVAKECGINFISIKGPELLNKYIGASEQSVRDLFKRANQANPCILFFDEFDSIAPRRGHDNTGVTDRVVNQLLTQLDGVESLQGVYVLAATSRPDLIDPALLRPGRLDKTLYCGIPDINDRIDILRAVSRKMVLDDSIDFHEISEKCHNYTGADLQALLYNAQLEAIHDSMPELNDLTNMHHNGSGSNHSDKLSVFTIDDNSKITSASSQLTNELIDRIDTIISNSIVSPTDDYPSDIQNNKNGRSTNTSSSSKVVIRKQHIDKAIKSTRSSVSNKERIMYERIYADFLGSRGDFSVAEFTGLRQTLA